MMGKCTCSGKKIWVFRKQGEADIEGAGETGNNKKRHDRRKGEIDHETNYEKKMRYR